MKARLSYWLFVAVNVVLAFLWLADSKTAYEIGGQLALIGQGQAAAVLAAMALPGLKGVLLLVGMQILAQMSFLLVSTALCGKRALILSAICLVWGLVSLYDEWVRRNPLKE